MPAAAIDTLKVSHKLQSAGMPRKQAEAVAKSMADTVEDRAGKDAMKDAVDTLGRAIDKRFDGVERRLSSLEQGQTKLEQGQAKLEQGQTKLEQGQTKLEQGQTQIMGLLAKILDGQAVLHQNDMELKRRLDERKV